MSAFSVVTVIQSSSSFRVQTGVKISPIHFLHILLPRSRPVPHRRLRFSNTTTTPCKRIKTSIDCSFSYFIHGGVSMPVRNGAVFVPRSTAPTIRVRKEARDQFASASSTHSEESQQPERAPFCISQAPPNPRWAPKSPVGRPPSVVDRRKTVAGESSVLPLIVNFFLPSEGHTDFLSLPIDGFLRNDRSSGRRTRL